MDSEISRILSTSRINGPKYWARADGDIHAPAGFSTIDVLNTLGNLDVRYDDYPIVREAIDYVFSYYNPAGHFKYNAKSTKLPCITARILTAFGRLGYEDERLDSCYRHLLKIQGKDGGWRCPTSKLGKSPETDASNPGTTLYVLDAFLYRDNDAKEKKQLENGVVFLLDHWTTRLPLGPCRFGIGTTFRQVEYPLIRYNILYYCFVLSKYEKALKDKRFQEAAALLKTKIKDGKLVNENPHRAWREYSFAQKGKASGPATKLARGIV